MGRLYSGNLNDFRAASLRLRAIGFVVGAEEWADPSSRKGMMYLRIESEAGESIMEKHFAHHDEDCLYNEATSWLNKQYNDLKSWS